MGEEGKNRLAYILQKSNANSSFEEGDQNELIAQMKQYEMYKKEYAGNIIFDPTKTELSKLNCVECFFLK